MKSSFFWVGLCLCCPFVAVSRAQISPPLPPITAQPNAGEIALEGRISALGQGQFTLEVVAFTNPNGKRALLPAPKSKTIWSDAANLRIGELVTVIGTDNGATLQAREIVRAAQNSAPAAEKITPTELPAAKKPTQITPTANAATPPDLPTAFTAGELTITPVQGDFDYVQRVFPGWDPLTTTPVFVCTFDVAGGRGDIASRLIVRRIVGPNNQFVAPAPFGPTAHPIRGQTNRVGFYNAEVNPNWEWIDLDLDVLPAQNERAGGKIVLKDLVLPATGAETLIDRDFSGPLGTRFTAIKLKRDDKGELYLVIDAQRPATPTDLEIRSYRVSYAGKTMGLASASLRNRRSTDGYYISLIAPEKATVLPQVELEVFEGALSLEDRTHITRQRLRFPLRKTQTFAPFKLENATQPLGVGATDELRVRVESDGLNAGPKHASLLLWMQATPDDTQRGIRWSIADGSATFDNGAPAATVSRTTSALGYRWHSDETPIGDGETIGIGGLALPAGAKSYDLKMNLEGRTVIEDWFERTIEVPRDKAIATPPDDEEHSLILRKVQRFSSPDDLENYPNWIRGEWPNAGLVLVFEVNPLLPDADLIARALDAEDGSGRAFRMGVFSEKKLYRIDMTQAGASREGGKFYTLVLSEPAQGADKIRVWLSVTESARKVEKATVEIKNIDAALSLR